MIRALQVSKVYRSYPGPFALLREISSGKPSHRPFAALESVSFQVPKGESFGIIGNNGAGKSTLLKILAGTCAPTSGGVHLQGRVAALLELGVGFDPEFTGRRNLYFGGTLAGFSREEIARRESGIIEFSGLGDEIDRPVKTYSAGMMLRLAFSLSTSFEPEVLIVDEVLAVGDGEFQSKCLDRIQGLRDRGCTAVLCSHALHQIQNFCSRALWLHRGRVQAMGSSREVVGRYRDFCQTGSREWDPVQVQEAGSRKICWIDDVKLERPRTGPFRTGESLKLDVSARFLPEFHGTPGLGVAVVRDDGIVVYVTSTIFDGVPLREAGPGEYHARVVFPGMALLEGCYYFNVVATDTAGLQSYDLAEKKEPFSVTQSGSDSGLLRLALEWGGRGKRKEERGESEEGEGRVRRSGAGRVCLDDLVGLGLDPGEARRLAAEVKRLLGTCSSAECWRRISSGLLSPAHPFPVHKLLHRAVFGNEHDAGPAPIFVPAPDSVRETNLARVQEQLGLESYAELHAWSVENRSGYWEMMIRHLGIRFRTPPDKILNSTSDVENARWLPGARLNIAESCFGRGSERAVVYKREGAPLSSLTRKGLDSMSNRVANALPLLGVDQGDTVAIDMPMNVEAVAIYLGVIKAGCVALTVAESFSAPEVRTRFKAGKAKALFTQDRILRGSRELPLYTRMMEAGAPVAVVVPARGGLSEPLREGDLSWNDFLSENDAFKAVACAPDDAINILFSSGTTGEPKAIPFTHLTPIKCAADGCLHQDIREGDVVAWPTSLGWMMGPWLIYASLINGATIALFDGIPTSRPFCEFVQDAKVNVLGVVPTLVGAWRAGGCVEGLDWSSVRVFTSTGECSNPDDMHYLTSRAGYRPVVEYCGGTEIGGAYITGTVVQTSVASAFSTAALGMNLTILDRFGAESDQGEIFIVPPSIGLSTRLLNRNHHREYYAGTPQGPGGGLLRRHGDRMERLDNGYFRAQGRMDDTMNLGGIKVGSAEIERVLNRVPGIGETAAVAVSPPGGGATRLVVYAVPATPEPELDEQELMGIFQKAIADHLNPLFRLHDVKVVRMMPRTASNKILRRQLRSGYMGQDS